MDCCGRLQQQTSFQLCWHQSQQGMRQVRVKPPQEEGNMKVIKNHWTKIDLMGLGEWSHNEQKEAWELITEYASIFAMSDGFWVRHP